MAMVISNVGVLHGKCLKIIISNTSGDPIGVRQTPGLSGYKLETRVFENEIFPYLGRAQSDFVQDDKRPDLQSDIWLKLRLANGQEGYVAAIYARCYEDDIKGILVNIPGSGTTHPPSTTIPPHIVPAQSFIRPLRDAYTVANWNFGDTGAEGGHLGVDYFTRSGYGPDVIAIGDGEVVFAQKVGNYEDVIVTKHLLNTAIGPNFSSVVYAAYAHMDLPKAVIFQVRSFSGGAGAT